jgi:hypothetical protein
VDERPDRSHFARPVNKGDQVMDHNERDVEAGRDAELSWLAAVAAALLVVIIAVLAAAS